MPTEIYVVIDVGCHECGVGSEVVGAYRTLQEAEVAKDACDKRTAGWRDGGQTIAETFTMELPNAD